MTYDEMIGRIATGVRHTDHRWPQWFASVGGATLEDRIRAVFRMSGRIPTRPQYEEAARSMPAPAPVEVVREATLEMEAPKPAPRKRAPRKKPAPKADAEG